GVTLAGLVPIPLSPQLTAEEVEFVAVDCGASAIIGDGPPHTAFTGPVIDPDALEDLDGHGELPVTHAEDPPYLLYTSRTTQRPKGALHAHRSVYGRAMMTAWQDFQPSDVTLHPGTLNWTFTLGTGFMDPMTAGSHVVLLESPVESATIPE